MKLTPNWYWSTPGNVRLWLDALREKGHEAARLMGTVLIPKTKLAVSSAVAALLLAAAPVSAQENTTAPAQAGTDIGPSELSNFSLNGSVTRPADQPAATPTPTPAPTPRLAPSTVGSESAPSAPSAAIDTARRAVGRAAAQTDAARDILARPPTLSDTRPQPLPGAVVAGPSATLPTPEAGFSILPWIAALLLAAGAGAVIYFLRNRRDDRYAVAGGVDFERKLSPEPAPVPPPLQRRPEPASRPVPQPRHDPVPPRAATGGIAAAGEVTTGNVTARKPLPTTLMPRPASSQPAPQAAPETEAPSGGVVSTSLRPWIEVELSPERAMIDDNGAAIAFDVVLSNAGNAPARDVTVEAQLLNSGVQQDIELSAFFGQSEQASDPIPVIAPFSRISLRSAVRIPRDQIREYEVEGRKLFMPMVAVSTRYRWSSGEGQTGAGFLVGKGKEPAERLAPLRVDQGSRSWQGLGARRYEKGLRR